MITNGLSLKPFRCSTIEQILFDNYGEDRNFTYDKKPVKRRLFEEEEKKHVAMNNENTDGESETSKFRKLSESATTANDAVGSEKGIEQDEPYNSYWDRFKLDYGYGLHAAEYCTICRAPLNPVIDERGERFILGGKKYCSYCELREREKQQKEEETTI